MKYHIGDKVVVVGGNRVGIVKDTQLWTDAIRLMENYEAKAFINNLRAKFGNEFSKTWQRVYVVIGYTGKWYNNSQLELRGNK